MTTKITYLVSHYPAISHTFILNEIRHLRDQGLDIDVCSINDPDRVDECLTVVEQAEKKRCFYVKSAGIGAIARAHLGLLLKSPLRYFRGLGMAVSLAGGSPRELLYRLFYFAEAVVVAHRMQHRGSSHVHVHFGSEVATVGLLVKQVAPVGFSLTIHGSDEFYDAPGFHLTRKVEEADFIFCISHYTASQLMRLSESQHWNKISVAPLGVDVNHFSPQKKSDDHDTLNVLCVGRLNAAKGIHLLLKAVAHLHRQYDSLRLIVVGDGELRASLESLVESLGIADRVEFAGAVNQDGIPPYYQRADVFCLPSFAEGVPVVLMEAMSMEIPCVASRITGIPELIDDGCNGLLFTAADVDALTAALKRLLDDPVLRQKLGRAGRQKVLAGYDLNANFTALAHHFVEQLDGCESSQEGRRGAVWASERYV